MSSSSAVVAGTNATSQQYNDLRTDAITERRVVLFEIKGTILTGDDQIKIPVPYAAVVTKVTAKVDTGSVTLRFMQGATIIKSGIAIGTSYTDETSITNPNISTGTDVDLDVTAVSSGENLRGMLYYTVTK